MQLCGVLEAATIVLRVEYAIGKAKVLIYLTEVLHRPLEITGITVQWVSGTPHDEKTTHQDLAL